MMLDGFMVSQWKPLSWWHFHRTGFLGNTFSERNTLHVHVFSILHSHTEVRWRSLSTRENMKLQILCQPAKTNCNPLQLLASKSLINLSIERNYPCNGQPMAEKTRQLDQVFGRDAILPFWGAAHHHILHPTYSDKGTRSASPCKTQNI